MSLKSDLIAAKALIADPGKWIKNGYERDGCYCALGACRKALWGEVWPRKNTGFSSGDFNPLAAALRDALMARHEPPSIVDFNDGPNTTHADVIRLFDDAIAAAGDA